MIRLKKCARLAAGIIMLVMLTACGAVQESGGEAKISFTDDDGNEIALDAPAQRIISLYSAHTENLYYLGAQDSLIGNYHTAVYPPEAAFLDMYDYSEDPEKVIAANPDAVIIRPFISRKAPDFVKALKRAGICVVSLYPDSLDEFDGYINKLAALTGTEDKARQLLADFHGALDEIKAETDGISDKKNVFFETTDTNIRTATPGSMACRAIETAGGINIAPDVSPAERGSTIAEFGIERALENADIIDVYISQRGSMNSGGSLETISQRPGYDTVKAVKEGRVYTISEKLVSSPTFRYVKGVRELERFLYPELTDGCDEYRNDETATRRGLAVIMVRHEHMPLYLPSSSKYYDTPSKGHTFGLFKDVTWRDEDFDFIETAVYSGAAEWTKEGGDEYYYPDAPVTREELAKAVFVLGDFAANGKNTPVSDLSGCDNPKIVQTLVDNGVFELEDGCFMPKRNVTNNEIIEALDKL